MLKTFSSCHYEHILLVLTALNTLDQVTLYNFITLPLILTHYVRTAQQSVKHLRHHSENPGAVQSVTRQCKSSLFPCKAPELGPTTCEGISA